MAGGGRSDGLSPGPVVHFNCCLGCLSSGLTPGGRATRGMDGGENERQQRERGEGVDTGDLH